MKKLGLIMALLVLFSFLPGAIGCTPASPTISTSPTTQTTPTAAPTTPKTPITQGTFPPVAPPVEKPFKPLVFKYGDSRAHGAEPFYKVHKAIAWEFAMEGATDGRIVIEDYPNGSLLNYPLAEMQVGQGIADIGYGSRIQKGILPTMDIWKLPSVQGEWTAIENLSIHWFKLFDKMQKDFDALNLLCMGPIHLNAYLFITAKKPAYKYEDLKGMTLMTTDLMTVKLLQQLGVIVAPIPSIEGYEALQKGIADGGVWNWEGPFIFGWTDTFKPGYFIDAGGVVRGGGGMNSFMNKQSHDRVPKDLLDVFDYIMWRWDAVYFSAQIDGNVPLYIEDCNKRGIKIITWSDAEKARFAKISGTLIDDWVTDMEKLYKRGGEAAEIVKAYKDAVKEYVPPAPVPVNGPAGNAAEWNAVFGPGSNWGMGYKAYPNQTGLHTLEGGVFKPWK